MIVPEKPLWGGNKKVCMYVCTTMNVDHKNFPLFSLNETFIKRTPLLSRCGHLKGT